MTHPQLSLGEFTGAGYDKGRPASVQVAWLAVAPLFRAWFVPARIRVAILRLFGAEIGDGVLIRHGVKIHWPWKLSIGDNTWVGEGAWILNLEPVSIGSNSCVSQDVFLCAGSHSRQSRTFEFDNGPIVIGNGVWIAARSTILRGTSVGDHSVIGANCLVTSDVPASSIVRAPVSSIGRP
ncbi:MULTISPECIES: DapH/DapD/GlmU-related protein [Rhodococcus]|jgi:putative colanic acid biosynthesis acetyltransferase WcaF|uniref:DapH/DapD/GlmU-related protein n=1 Tax=Rhodococcus qingshengii TaxID=334542 RepID=A0AAW6LH28_RHOSG|nr:MULTISPECIES: DapH/DapD/GlmU-related protein [Rhodococcus]RGP50551.1 acetyltransferase [Rhodococcus erythropolis]ANQ72368.1 acetyltransferase [Rhodococcus sp. 008]AZI60799.1 putative colanic acid biosynthesis acetyltransferase [Rhodococcus sp. NJ-530]MBP1051946.1 putative colanic acid biosynthesis acetyltransferase [Rhodococcus qingshengii]MBP2521269.1 putative colanic acid biosynthesis acetyltransferase WcaF [Rhodococcus sp. PvP104]